MKKYILIICLALPVTVFSSCGYSSSKEKPDKKMELVQTRYTFPMHPEVISEKEGRCPKCGMDLVKK